MSTEYGCACGGDLATATTVNAHAHVPILQHIEGMQLTQRAADAAVGHLDQLFLAITGWLCCASERFLNVLG